MLKDNKYVLRRFAKIKRKDAHKFCRSPVTTFSDVGKTVKNNIKNSSVSSCKVRVSLHAFTANRKCENHYVQISNTDYYFCGRRNERFRGGNLIKPLGKFGAFPARILITL